jgi:hypothetical protein
MRNLFKRLSILSILAFVLATSCSSGPDGIYYGGVWDDPDEFYYEFKDNGTISICRGSLYERNCCADGNWETKGNSIIISGISNVNCPEMSTLNGNYKSCNKPDCIPSGKAYKKGDITIWPDKK